MNDYGVKNLYASIIGTFDDSNLPRLNRNHIELDITPISNYSDLERVLENFLEEETSSFCSLDALLSDVGGGINSVEVPMPTRFFTENKIQANLKRREPAKDYIQLLLKTDGCDPNDADMKDHLNL